MIRASYHATHDRRVLLELVRGNTLERVTGNVEQLCPDRLQGGHPPLYSIDWRKSTVTLLPVPFTHASCVCFHYIQQKDLKHDSKDRLSDRRGKQLSIIIKKIRECNMFQVLTTREHKGIHFRQRPSIISCHLKENKRRFYPRSQ